MNNRNVLFLVILIIVCFVGSLLFVTFEQERTNTKLGNILAIQNKQIQNLSEKINQKQVEGEKNKLEEPVVRTNEKITPKFSTIDEYVNFALDRTKSSFLEGDQPEGFTATGGTQDVLNLAPIGSGYDFVGVLVEERGPAQVRNLDEIRPFYIEVYKPASLSCKGFDCKTVSIHAWYGPFEGPVLRMVQ